MTPFFTDRRLTIFSGDCREVMAEMEPESVQCVITSPPYFGLRDYGIAPSVWGGEIEDAFHGHIHDWGGSLRTDRRGVQKGKATVADARQSDRGQACPCGAWLGVLGLEPTVELYVAHVVEVFRGVRRVLRKDGTVWLNLGDSYAGGATKPHKTMRDSKAMGGTGWTEREQGTANTLCPGFKPKDRMMVPARVALALQADGWWLRDEIVWAKPNPMPSSVTDRTTPAHEMLYLLTKSPRYFYDAEAIREPDSGQDHRRQILDGEPSLCPPGQTPYTGIRTLDGRNGSGRNKRSVWTIPTAPYPDAHFATFPPKLIEPMILAGTSERGCCPECGAPWERETEIAGLTKVRNGAGPNRKHLEVHTAGESSAFRTGYAALKETTGWHPTCKHDAEPVPCVILDPFGGSGTVAMVARAHNRKSVLIDLSPDYCRQMLKRATAEWIDDEPVVDVQPTGLWETPME